MEKLSLRNFCVLLGKRKKPEKWVGGGIVLLVKGIITLTEKKGTGTCWTRRKLGGINLRVGKFPVKQSKHRGGGGGTLGGKTRSAPGELTKVCLPPRGAKKKGRRSRFEASIHPIHLGGGWESNSYSFRILRADLAEVLQLHGGGMSRTGSEKKLEGSWSRKGGKRQRRRAGVSKSWSRRMA